LFRLMGNEIFFYWKWVSVIGAGNRNLGASV
jgi:hypothetical protein